MEYIISIVIVLFIFSAFFVIMRKRDEMKKAEKKLNKEKQNAKIIEDNYNLLTEVFNNQQNTFFKDFYDKYQINYIQTFQSLERIKDIDNPHFVYFFLIADKWYALEDTDDLSFESSLPSLLYQLKKKANTSILNDKTKEVEDVERLSQLITLESFNNHFNILSEIKEIKVADNQKTINFISKEKNIICKVNDDDYIKVKEKLSLLIK